MSEEPIGEVMMRKFNTPTLMFSFGLIFLVLGVYLAEKHTKQLDYPTAKCDPKKYPCQPVGPYSNLQPYYETDLGKAMTICERHLPPRGAVSATNPPKNAAAKYDPGWGACSVALEKWYKTERGREQLEYDAQEKQDRAFVERVAKESSP